MGKFDLFNNLFEPVVVLNKNYGIEYYNSFFVTFFKSSPRQIKNLSSIDDLFELEGKDLKRLFDEVLKSQSVVLTEELKLILKNAGIEYRVVLKLSPLDGHVLLCLNDFSIENRLQEKYKQQLKELKSSHIQLLQSDKLATIGQLSAGISHEINTPLTVAYGNAQNIEFILDSEGELPLDKIKNFNTRICEALEKMSSIISNMKSFVHKPEEQKEYCDLCEIIKEALSLVNTGWAHDHVNLDFERPKEAQILLINKLELEQVLVNLVQNAIDAIEEIGRKEGKVAIRISNEVENKSLEIRVCDNAGGIPENIQEEVFTPFYTTKGVEKGTGLGLAISKNLIEKHGGEISIESSSASGTVFLIKFPMIEDSSISHNQKLVDSLMDGNIKRILVVDDEPEILNLLEDYIQKSGHLFIGSSNGQEALKLVDEFDVDIVITDYYMPGLNGTELATKIRELGRDTPIFYLSSEGTESIYKKDKNSLKISGLILKPFTEKEVIKALGIEKVL